MPDDLEYDLAFSFAGEHRQYVEETKLACAELDLKVFYDRDLSNEWWGNSFIRAQREVYGHERTKYFVPFISDEYFRKPIPADEFAAAMWEDVQRGGGYILPVVIGNVRIPRDRLPSDRHYLKAEDYTPQELAQALSNKVRGTREHPPREITSIVQEALNLRLPKAIPNDFSKYREQEESITYLGSRFRESIPQLVASGYVGTVDATPDRVRVRVEFRGETACLRC